MWLTHLPMSIYILEKLDGGFTEPRKKKKSHMMVKQKPENKSRRMTK